MRLHLIDTLNEAPGGPVLLLHGIGGSSGSFAAQIPALSTRHRVLAWDAPGYGRSGDPSTPPGMSGYAALAASLLPGPAHVVGVSWGGVVATRLALEHPGLVRSLVLADSTRGSGRTPEQAAAMRGRAAELERLGGSAFAAARGPRLLSPQAPQELVDRVVTAMERSIRLPGYTYAASAMAGTDHNDVLGSLSVPVLVVVGDQDRVTGVAESQAIAAAVPGARLAVVPGAGHLANQERPEEFNRLVLDFLASVPSPVAEA
ncbi:alpha/beta fold hydrolase [Streptosporangium carneum]|uniref:3-oxoadipate enol-lactonase n=1 Tax=Streptosporangium carneum TaxID=47481 RepID=A0A9W6ME21_9ACTN|nr:alpha/beta fold hydrolase [Streptosporangium carneum]GLK10677.1 3-oxoadipate enol-lactonase [Streptosporangium carneum]